MGQRRVVFITPWLPQYRVPFFEGLRDHLAESGIRLDLLYGQAPAEFEARQDAASIQWATPFRTKKLTVGSKHVVVTPFVRDADMVIMEQHMKQVMLYAQLAASKLRFGPSLAMWGHGDGRRTIAHPLATRLKGLIASLPDHWFVYTEQGGDFLRDKGVRDSDLTVFNNTIDADDLCAINGTARSAARSALDLADGPVALHIGGLDLGKRIDLLIETADRIHEEIPTFTLLVAGAGSDQGRVEAATQRGSHIRYLGPTFGEDRSTAFAAADVLLHPGKIGLVAIDSFAAGRPLVAAARQTQAPEFDYLDDSNALIVAEPLPDLLADACVNLLNDADRLSELSAGARNAYSLYPLSEMILRVADGIAEHLG